MSVDLPAPFSPMTACTSPRITDRETSRLATQAPKRFHRCEQPIASPGGALIRFARSLLFRPVGHVDLAGDDVLAQRLDARAHLVADERGVVLVEHVIDAALLRSELQHAALPLPVAHAPRR